MKRASVLLRPGVLAAGALAGLISAHALDYRLLIGDPVRRREILMTTGHGWLPSIESVAVACAVAAVVGALLFHGRSAPRERGFRATAARLAIAQAAAFVVLEFGERIFAGAPLHHLTPGLLTVGLILQAITAVAVAGGLRLIGRAGARLSRALRATPRRPRRTGSLVRIPAEQTTALHRFVLTAADPVRGPPLAAAS